MDQAERDWHKWRSQRVTGSRVAALMGMSPWMDREELFESYVYGIQRKVGRSAWWGTQQEVSNMHLLTKLAPLEVTPSHETYEYGPCLGATIDGYAKLVMGSEEGIFGDSLAEPPVGLNRACELTSAPTYWRRFLGQLEGVVGRGDGLVEMKNTGERYKKDWSSPPEYYWAQLQCQLLCSGLQWGVLCAKVGSDDMRAHVVEIDEGWCAELDTAAREFWAEVQEARAL